MGWQLPSLLFLEDTARYAGLLLTPAEVFGLWPWLFLPFGQKKALLCYPLTFRPELSSTARFRIQGGYPEHDERTDGRKKSSCLILDENLKKYQSLFHFFENNNSNSKLQYH